MRKLCEDIANSIENAIRGYIGADDGGKILYMGADGTPTARIDDVAERAALRVLKNDGRSVRLVSEEMGEVVFGSNPEFTIVLDPLDGTYNALRGIPFYSVSIAIGKTDLSQIYYGYVKNLVTGDVYAAERDRGALLNGKKIRVSTRKEADPYCASIYGCAFAERNFLNQNGKKVRLLGSAALELCYVAAGKLDAFVDARNRLRISDVAAGKLIVEEAGGVVTDDFGGVLSNPLMIKERVKIVASNGRIHDDLLVKLREWNK
ncbi:MAG: bifunctional fructose-bisphosphatase/inositol-phosphate phosphatase [Methanosarcinales archaeon]|nr:MAG: bifunctional fructose-bisphosphatase/inositol-phosphate phosphatase [Methanosarcinales archaeon]